MTRRPRIYDGPPGQLLRLAELRMSELKSLRALYDSCSWWEWRRRRAIGEKAAALVKTIEGLLIESERLDGGA